MSEFALVRTEIAAVMHDTYRECRGGIGGTWPVPVVKELPTYLPPVLRVDYVWHSSHFRAISAHRGPRLGSDHIPLWAEFELLRE